MPIAVCSHAGGGLASPSEKTAVLDAWGTEHVVDDQRLDGLQVLVVDDEPDSRQMVAHVLKRHGASVITAGAVDEALRHIDEDPPHLLIADIGMPGRDGYDLIGDVRSRGHDAQVLPAIALTAFARPQDRARALAAGYQVHAAKPVDGGALVAMAAGLCGRADASGNSMLS